MYTQHFSLTEKPFAITPDPRYLFLSERHADALAHLLYGINEAGGFIQLTGEVGTGKTTLVRALLERMPGHTDVAVLLNPRVSPLELLQSICQELGVVVPESATQSIKALIDLLNERLLSAHASGRRVVIILDEAQNLSEATLEQVRLLTNLETASRKLLQIILIGQPELRTVLARSELRQLAQRITGRFHLSPLSRAGTAAYVKHRLKVASSGNRTGEIFSRAALTEVHRISGGIPRVINVVCDRALLGAYTEDHQRIDAALVRSAAGEVYGRHYWPHWFAWAGGVTGIVAVGILAYGVRQLLARETPQPTIATLAPAPIPITPPPLADIQTVLAAQTQPLDSNVAFVKLLELWGAQFAAENGRPCDQALAQGLECVYQKGSWGQLRLLNRPAVLSLSSQDGRTHRVVVTALDDDRAQVAVGNANVEVSLASLSRDWQGEYLILWRPAWMAGMLGTQEQFSARPREAGQRALSIGMRGNEVRWLRQNLDSLAGAASATDGSDYYDAALAARIEQFQREHRLTVDGIAGVQTQIVLDSLVNAAGAPRLLSERTATESSRAQSQQTQQETQTEQS